MKSNRWKLEIEIYGEKEAINKTIELLIQSNGVPFQDKDCEIYMRHFQTNFSPKKFFKMCKKLEKKAYLDLNKKRKTS